MTTLAAADGRLLSTRGPLFPVNAGPSPLYGPFPALWSDGSSVDAYGDHGPQPGHGFAGGITYDQAYATFPAVHAVVNKLARQMATLPAKVYRLDENGERRRVRASDTGDAGASLARLIESPTPRRGAVHFKQWLFLPALVFGNSLVSKWYGEGKNSPPTELIPLDWRFVSAYAPMGGEVEVWGTSQLGPPQRYVAVEDTIHLAWNAATGAIGTSPLQALARALQLEDAAQRTQTASFRNGARPSGLVVPGDTATVTKETLGEMKRQLEATHKGPDNSFRVAALAPGSSWVPLTFNSVEHELMASRTFNRLEVCIAYDVKPVHIGDQALPGASYSSVVEQNKELYRTTLRPWLTLAEETLKAQLIDPEPAWDGLFVEFDMAELLKGEPGAVAQQIALEIGSGTMTQNEGRDLQNRARSTNPLADELWMPTNNLTPTSMVGAAVGESDPSANAADATPPAPGPVDPAGVPGVSPDVIVHRDASGNVVQSWERGASTP